MRASSVCTCARVRSARRCSTWAWNGVGSSSARSWPFFTVAVEVGVEAGDDAGDLTADLHGRDGGKRPGGRDGHRHVAAVDLLGLVLLVFLAAALAGQESGGEEQRRMVDASEVQTRSPANTTGRQPSLKRAEVYRMLRRHFSRSTETNGSFLQRTRSRSASRDAAAHDTPRNRAGRSSAPTSPSRERSPAPSRSSSKERCAARSTSRPTCASARRRASKRPSTRATSPSKGKLNGDISADDRVELVASATVDGNIKAPKIIVAEGAKFRGSVDMGSRVPKDEPHRRKRSNNESQSSSRRSQPAQRRPLSTLTTLHSNRR